MPDRAELRKRPASRQDGLSLPEVAVALALLSTVALGVLGGIVDAAEVQRTTRTELECLRLLDRMMEETQAVAFDGLIGLDGTFVEQNRHRADLTVVRLTPGLIQVQVDVTSTEFPAVNSTAVLLVASRD